jgi:hypothetical protein
LCFRHELLSAFAFNARFDSSTLPLRLILWKVKLQRSSRGQDHGALDHVAQFKDVARPIVTLKLNDASTIQAGFGAAEFLYGQFDEMLR